MGTGRRCRPAARETKQNGTVDLVGSRRLDRADEARYCDGRSCCCGPDLMIHDADSSYNGVAIQNNTYDSKQI